MGFAKVEDISGVNVKPHGVQADQATVHQPLHERVGGDVLQLVQRGHLRELIGRVELIARIDHRLVRVVALHEDQAVLVGAQHRFKVCVGVAAIPHEPAITMKDFS